MIDWDLFDVLSDRKSIRKKKKKKRIDFGTKDKHKLRHRQYYIHICIHKALTINKKRILHLDITGGYFRGAKNNTVDIVESNIVCVCARIYYRKRKLLKNVQILEINKNKKNESKF